MTSCEFPCLISSRFIRRHIHGKRVLVVTNTTVAPLYLDKTISALTDGNPNVTVESVILPDGEQFKNMVSSFGIQECEFQENHFILKVYVTLSFCYFRKLL